MTILILMLLQSDAQPAPLSGAECEYCDPWGHIELPTILMDDGAIDWQLTFEPLELPRLYSDLKVASTRRLVTRAGALFWDVEMRGHALQHGIESTSCRILLQEVGSFLIIHPMARVKLRDVLQFEPGVDPGDLLAASLGMCMHLTGERIPVTNPTVVVDQESKAVRVRIEAGRGRSWNEHNISHVARLMEFEWRDGVLKQIKESRPPWIPSETIRGFESDQINALDDLSVAQAEIEWPRFWRSTLVSALGEADGPFWSMRLRNRLGIDLTGACIPPARLLDMGPAGPAFSCRIAVREGREISIHGLMRGLYSNEYHDDEYSALISLGSILRLSPDARGAAIMHCFEAVRSVSDEIEFLKLEGLANGIAGSRTVQIRFPKSRSFQAAEAVLQFEDGWLVSVEKLF